MQSIGAFEAKTHFSTLLSQVENGEQITITKHGHPVAKLVPISTKKHHQARHVIQQLKKFAQSNRLDGLDWKTLRDEGRR